MTALLAGLTLAALVLGAALTNRVRQSGAVALGALGLLWLVVNRPMEGSTLLVITPTHGLTAADLAGAAAVALAGWRSWTIRRRTRAEGGS